MLIHDDIPLHFDPRSTDLFRRRRPDPLHLSMDLPSCFRDAEGAGSSLADNLPDIDRWTTRDKLALIAIGAVLLYAGYVAGVLS